MIYDLRIMIYDLQIMIYDLQIMIYDFPQNQQPTTEIRMDG